jgi:hypothetical protein
MRDMVKREENNSSDLSNPPPWLTAPAAVGSPLPRLRDPYLHPPFVEQSPSPRGGRRAFFGNLGRSRLFRRDSGLPAWELESWHPDRRNIPWRPTCGYFSNRCVVESRHLKANISGFGPNSRHEAALFVAMHATETVRPAIVSLRRPRVDNVCPREI